MFTDRTDAGKQLAAALRRSDTDADVVLGIPRGGLPVARPVADALDRPLDIVVATKVGAPGNDELAVAAVADDGTTWRNESLIGSLDLTTGYIEDATAQARREARETFTRYRDGRSPLDLAGRRALLVDDGFATGATMSACVRRVTGAGADRVVVAVPVGSPRTADSLSRLADEVVVLEAPQNFSAVGQFYERFTQVSDESAMALLE